MARLGSSIGQMEMTITVADDGAASPRRPTPAQHRALRRLHDTMGAFEAQLQCPICLCAYATPASLPCNHCFCEECIHRALELKQVCPICKAPAKKRSLRHDTMIQQLQQAVELWMSVTDPVDTADDESTTTSIALALPSNGHDTEIKSEQTTPIRINPLIVSRSAESATRRRRRDVKQDLEEAIPIKNETGNDHMKREESTPPRQNGKHALGCEQKVSVKTELHEPPVKKRALTSHSSQQNGATPQTPDVIMVETTNGCLNGDESEGSQPFSVGQLVEVIDRTWRGINKPGGAAWIMHIHDDGTYDVKYIIGTRRESRVPDQYILMASEEIVSQATPGRAVKQHRRKAPAKLKTPPSVDLLGGNGYLGPNGMIKASNSSNWRSDLVFLCSGYTEEGNSEIRQWAAALGATVVDQWSHFVTHLIAKCATPKEVAASAAEDDGDNGSSSHAAASRKRSLFQEDTGKRWIKIRSMKYLKALVAGRWIVSEAWLRDCVRQGKRLAEVGYEADGHLKAQNVSSACRRARTMREDNLRSSDPELVNPLTVGSRLFVDFCFHIYGEFLPPMPPPSELDMLIRLGNGKVLRFLDDISMEMDMEDNKSRTLVIVCDKLNPHMLRRTAKELMALPQLQSIDHKQVVSYQWVLNSITEAKLRPFN